MVISAFLRRVGLRAITALLLFLSVNLCFAGSVRGVVTDATGAKVSGASVALVSKGKVVASVVSASDGSFQLTTGTSGRYFLVVSARSFRQLQTPDFYSGQFDSIQRNLVLEPEWVRQSIVVTATGTPTPQPQTGAATSVLSPTDLALRDDFVSALRLMPGAFVTQSGQRGAQTSLFIRGGDSDDNKVLLDGVDAGDLGGQFDFGNLSTTGIQDAEIYRGPDSNLYGANADSGVVSFTTPHGTTSFPSLIFAADAGNFNTTRERFELAGARGKLDYLGALSWFQTSNALPNDEYHLGSGAANLGWQPNGSTQIRGVVHYNVAGTGVPNAWNFFHIADDASEKDQDLYLSASIDNQTAASFHNTVRYGLTRKREQNNLWTLSGNPADYVDYCYGPGTFGNVVTITGANGYSATGQAALDCSTYGSQLVSNRDALTYHGDVTITPHLGALIGFQYEDERGAEPGSSYYPPVERTNYDYIAAVHGDFKNRFYYTLGGSLEHYSLFGTQTNPRAGISWFVLRPRSGVFSGTRILFNFGDAVREPSLPQQDYSLYTFLAQNGGQDTIQQLHIGPLAAPQARTYEGGVEQSFLGEHIIFRASYFHNQFGKEIESVGLDLIPALLPNLSAAEQQQLAQILEANYAYELDLNSEAFRAQGVEATVESGIGKSLFFRGGYTYLDAVVQRSFTNDDETLLGPIPTFDGIPVGPYSPLEGARPFRRAPHTGFFTATYAQRKLTGLFTAAFASRSDDTTFLEGEDANGGNSLLLPNRNLDFGYAKLDLGGSFQLLPFLSIYGHAENLLSDQHIAPIGYPSLPFNFRTGLRIDWGPGSSHQH
ncbi:MAG TPA: TonB-dependent receptor [Terracidiphilus sp.]|jgi:iron complex outermembrane receptor protein/vitamin B12 transporter|nr:TonB-dependent receptor [Terracidiphilus sp.]